ncbi:lysophospholipid acyltransferase family protein [Cecembia lonarensis]|uniref:2-acyl-glycerophospho-ethanolamine acyltransferase n=1 Tax=Cecembia lonarensis (strain CCUG 58316 / KCTC 22772 / LW9) TaxID=1225176 RepID=K1L9J6_CECL9|nr:lysophospholipid acyltransferase family protein [Cecembia lonarensis]EKB48877.1 2-acyl-glycerophospho-ethanolamine acyltransferase [Cecembia lonarensis LW9]
MKNTFNALLRRAVWLALHLYFKKIRVFGKENLPKGKAVLIVANHQNALIDPILIATHTQLKPHFLTRASAFKNPIAAKLLDFIRMIPIYRVRDGIDNMGKNKETFEKSVKILSNKGSLLIFGEGNHDMHRSLRPLKKGFARIAFQTLDENPELELLILPIGINYSNHKKSGSNVGLYIGDAFPANDYYPKNYEGILLETAKRLKPLVSHVPKERYEEWMTLLVKEKVDLTNPEMVKKFIEGQGLKKVEDPTFSPYFTNKVMKVFHFPVYWIWLWLKTKIKDPTFTATFKFVIGLVFIPFWYLFLFVGLPTLGWEAWILPWTFLGIIYLISNTSEQA